MPELSGLGHSDLLAVFGHVRRDEDLLELGVVIHRFVIADEFTEHPAEAHELSRRDVTLVPQHDYFVSVDGLREPFDLSGRDRIDVESPDLDSQPRALLRPQDHTHRSHPSLYYKT